MPKRLKFVVLTIGSLLLLLAFASGAVAVTGNEQIWTDKPDYAFAETAVIFGAGFESYTLITLKITAPDSTVFTDTFTTEANGSFIYHYVLNGLQGTYLAETLEFGTSNVLATTTFTESPGVQQTLEGFNRVTSSWTSGVVKGYYETEAIPFRLTLDKAVIGDSYVLKTYFDHLIDSTLGIDYFENFGVSGGTATLPPTGPLTDPSYPTERYYEWTVTATSTTVQLSWGAHLAQGAHEWPGASLHVRLRDGGQKDVPIPVNAIGFIDKTDAPDPINVGQTTTYNIKVHSSDQDETNLVVTDTLPTGLSYAGNATPTPTSVIGNTITWTIPSLAKNSDAIITFDAQGVQGGTWTNHVEVVSDQITNVRSFNETTTVNEVFSVDLTPATDTNPTGSNHTVTATLTDSSGAVSGVTVYFNVTAGPNMGDTGSSVTDGNGQDQFTYPGDGGAGDDTIEVWADINGNTIKDSGEPSDTATKTWVTYILDLSPSVDTNPTGTNHTVTATLTNGSGPVSGVTVYFMVTAGPNMGDNGSSVTDDGNGQDQFTYPGDGGAGDDTIEVWADINGNTIKDSGEPVTTATKSWVTYSLDLTPPTDTNSVNSNHMVTATLTDSSGPVSGVTVYFMVIAGPNMGDTGSSVTDGNGQDQFTYPGDGGPGDDTIEVWADINGDTIKDPEEPVTTATKTWVTLDLSPPADTNPANANHTVTATLTNGSGLSGVTVYFNVIAGPNFGDSGSSVTDVNGQDQFMYPGDGGPGTDTILVWADLDGDGIQDPEEPTDTATKTWVTYSLDLTPPTDNNPVNSNHTLTATLSGGPPINNVPIRFHVILGPNTSDSGTDLTDPSGEATFTYPGNSGAGTDTIKAYADFNGDGTQDPEDVSDTAQKTWVTYTLNLSPLDDTNFINTNHTITATLSGGPPVNNILIRFAVNGFGPNSGDTGADLTDLGGQAQFTYPGDGGTGTDTIIAWADFDGDGIQDPEDVPATVNAQKTWQSPQPPVATTITLTPGSDINNVGDSHTVTANVKDQFGVPMPNVKVYFKVTGANFNGGLNDGWAKLPGTIWAASTPTNTSGNIIYTYTGTNAGPDTIKATADANSNGTAELSEPSNTATKNWQPPPTGINSSLIGLGAFLAMALGILLVRKNPIKFF